MLCTVLVAGLGLCACGSSGTSRTSGASASAHQEALAFSRCMRAHGLPQFPDPGAGGALIIPTGTGTGTGTGIGTGIDTGSPAFQSAQRACSSTLPSKGVATPLPASQRKGILQYSACMRSHGLPGFPNPTFSDNKASGGAGAQIKIGKSAGFDPSSPAFVIAQSACESLLGKLPGRIAGQSEH